MLPLWRTGFFRHRFPNFPKLFHFFLGNIYNFDRSLPSLSEFFAMNCVKKWQLWGMPPLVTNQVKVYGRWYHNKPAVATEGSVESALEVVEVWGLGEDVGNLLLLLLPCHVAAALDAVIGEAAQEEPGLRWFAHFVVTSSGLCLVVLALGLAGSAGSGGEVGQAV